MDDYVSDNSDESELPWIERFCEQKENEFLCKVEREFIGKT